MRPATAAIPSNFFVVQDQDGANDVNSAQVDLTQMGRDDTDPTVYKLFWSWDATDEWTGTGSTGDACALFDTNGNGRIDNVVCGQVHNTIPTVVVQTAGSPFAFSCNDARFDRCGQPSLDPVYPGPDSGRCAHLRRSRPESAGEPDHEHRSVPQPHPDQNWPNDSTLEVVIAKSFLPAGAVLVNVCSYPSAGNGGNNNPFDCVMNPGGGFLVIVKNAGTNTSTPFVFAVSPVPSGQPTNYTILGSNRTSPIGVTIGTSSETVTESVPANWALTTGSCTLSNGTTPTGAFEPANHRITGITIQSGLATTCTFTDVNAPALTVTKDNDADHDGTFGDTETVPGNATYPYTVTYRATIHNGAANPATISSIADNKVAAPLRSASTTDTDCADVIENHDHVHPVGVGRGNLQPQRSSNLVVGDRRDHHRVGRAHLLWIVAFGLSDRSRCRGRSRYRPNAFPLWSASFSFVTVSAGR